MPKRRTKRKFLFPAVATTSILVTGGVAYWWLTQQQKILPEAAIAGKVIPSNAYFTVAVSTDSAKWEQLQAYGTPETKAIFNSQLASLKKRFLTDKGYDYQRDIQPWIGKQVLIGYIPYKDLNRRKEGQFIAVLPIADKLKAQQLLSNQPSGTERTYKGIKINQQQGLTATVLGDDIIAATSPEAVEIAVDTFLDTSGIAIGNNPAFRSALAKVDGDRSFANVYLNLATLTDLAIARAPANFPRDIVTSQTNDAISGSVNLEPERIKFDGVLRLKPKTSPALAVENQVTDIPTLLPAETVMLVSGSSFESLWRDISSGSQSNTSPIAPFKAKDVEDSLRSLAGLDLQADVLPWMKQEFSLSLIPKSGTDNGTVGLILMAKASDRAAAERAFSKLDSFVAQKYQIGVSQDKIAELPVTNWRSQSGSFAGDRGFLTGDLAFINLGDAVTPQILPKPQASLVNNPLYRLATDGNLTAINAQFFLDLEKTVHPGNLSLPRILPQQNKLLRAIKAVGLTANVSDEQTYSFELAIVPEKF